LDLQRLKPVNGKQVLLMQNQLVLQLLQMLPQK
jgi:hypothetical protein